MVPGLSPDDLASAKELVYAIEAVPIASGICKVAIPVPAFKPTGMTPANFDVAVEESLLGMYAVRVVDAISDRDPADDTLTVMEQQHQSGVPDFIEIRIGDDKSHVEFDFPEVGEGERWSVIAIYMRGTAQVRSCRSERLR